MDEATQRQLIRGAQLRELLQQAPAQPLSVVQQVAIIYTGTRTSILDNVGDLTAIKGAFLSAFGSRSPWLSGNVTTLEEKAHRQISGQIGTAIHGLAIRHAEDGCIHGYQPSSKAGTAKLKLVEAIEPCIWVPRDLATPVECRMLGRAEETNELAIARPKSPPN